MILKKIKIEGMIDKPFLIIPQPFKNELLTSWLVRTAYAHHLHPHTFFKLHLGLPHYSCTSTKLDTALNSEKIDFISNKCMNHVDIYNLTLNSYNGYLQEVIVRDSINRLLCDCRFCPKCLREDKIPYFRKHWMISFYTVCLKHKCFMYDRCPQCNTKIDISKMYQNKYSYKYCYKCKFELSKARTIPISKAYEFGFNIVKHFIQVLQDGYIEIEDHTVYSFLYFDSILQLNKKILKHQKYKWIDNHPLFKLLHLKEYSTTTPIHVQLSIKEQFALFGLSTYLLDNYPSNLKHYIKNNKLSHWRMVKDMSYVSFWYENLINGIVPRYVPYTRIITDKEIENAKQYLRSRNMMLNKANMTKLMGCNFFSIYNKLSV